MCGRRLIDKSFLTLMQYVTSLTPIWRIASTMFWPCETRTSTCLSFATISSGLYRFLAIAVLLDVKDIPQVGPLQWGWITVAGESEGWPLIILTPQPLPQHGKPEIDNPCPFNPCAVVDQRIPFANSPCT